MSLSGSQPGVEFTRITNGSSVWYGRYTETTLSAATTFSAKIFGFTKLAFFALRSSSVTPRATEHFPQMKSGTRCATTSSIIAVSVGIATGITASATAAFIR